LYAVVTQMCLDVCDGMTVIQHIHRPTVTKAVDRIDILEALWRKDLFQILSADPVNAMPGEFLPPLIDKNSVLIGGFWRDTVFPDIKLQQMTGFRFKG